MPSPLSPRQLIVRKRDGHAHTADEIRAIMEAVTGDGFSDAQVGAWLMAVCLRGLDDAETVALTAAMRDSGARFDLRATPRPKLDKHSTGGVGDKVSLILAPLMAACGLAVPMISGRGLGHTGGTLDKLESIPGFRTDLSPAEVAAQVARLGVAMAAQTPEVVPADRRLYRLRDVTGTVENRSLVVASILSKKLVEDLDGLVLDVKFGSGAFFREETEARALAVALVETARALGLPTRALLTAMDEPLGRAVGNAVEVREVIEILRGHGPGDLRRVTLALGAEMLQLGGLSSTPEEALAQQEEAIASGIALRLFGHLIEAQGGDPGVLEDPSRLPRPAVQRSIDGTHTEPRWVCRVDARGVAEAALRLGAGRERESDAIDPAAGITALVKVGEPVLPGQRLACLGAASEARLDLAEALLRDAITLGEGPPRPSELIKERIL
jgi:pyrimidine-nucleoside phosphorylase